MRRGASLTAVVLACSLAAAPLGAQQAAAAAGDDVCTDGRITHIFVDNRSIFQVDELPEGSPLAWLYRLANALHITTRQSFIRREVLFQEGDCYDPFLLAESGRLLRIYPFIATADVYAVRQPDGNVHVVIDTQDDWTTKFDLGVAVDQGVQLERVDLTEENLLGRGMMAQVFYRRRRERRDLGFRVQEPRLLGTRADAQLGWGKTRVGNFFEEELSYPFFAEVGRIAARQSIRSRQQVFTYSTGTPRGVTHALLPFQEDWAEISAAARFGRPGRLTLLGFGLTREKLDFRSFPGDLEIAVDDGFGETVPAPEEIQSLVAPQIRPYVATRVNLMVGQRNLRFERTRGLDPLNGVQDVWLGTEVGLTLGRTLPILGAAGVPAPSDLFTRFRLFAGHDPGASYIFFTAALEGRRLLEGDGAWRDVLGEADAFGYLRSPSLPGHTLFWRASASGGWSPATPFQLTLGGREGVRGFREEASPGARRLLFTLEDRIYFRWPAPEVLDLGLSLFADAGRVWAGDVPWGTDSGWKGTLGFGIRMGFPTRTRTVGRIDLAFPVGGDPGQGPIFRITMYELLGITSNLVDGQLQRSRRSRIGPDFFVTDRQRIR